MPAITHTRETGTLIDGTAKGDGTNLILKACGWRWSRNLGTWYVPQSRDKGAKQHIIDPTAAELEAAGHPTTVDIDDTPRPTAEVEQSKAERAHDRAEALEAKAERRQDAYQAASDHARQLGELLPPMGQPILVDHYSAPGHRRILRRVHAADSKAVEALHAAEETERRAQEAAKATDRRNSPTTVANRIEKLKADQRRIQRRISGQTRTLFISNGVRHTEETAAATGERAERLQVQLSEVEDQIAYWSGIREEQIALGLVTDYGPKSVSVGDQVLFRGKWFEVRRVNPKSVSIPSMVGGSWTDTIPYREISGHRVRPESA